MKKFYKFPDGFYWGAATASYQVEGGIENNDWAEAARQGKVPPAGLSTDHYNRYQEDFDLAKELGHNGHRISIEWSRIEPFEGQFDEKEIQHYRDVLRSLHKRGLKPFVTLWHFTLPAWFSRKGGFENKKSPEIFARYCAYVVNQLKDLCDHWSTMNEPMVYASSGYLRKHWPPFRMSPFVYFKVINRLVTSHNLAYDEIKKVAPEVEVGAVKNNFHFTSDHKPWNILNMLFAKWFWNHYFLQRTFMKMDYIGLNYYFHQQFGRTKIFDQSDMGWDLNPEGIYYVLKGLKIYNKPVYITEAGIADTDDRFRAKYIKNLIYWIYQAINEKVDVKSYMYWSLLDNYEWRHGYVEDFGLIHVDDVTKKRTIRPSALEYKKICEDNGLTVE